MNEALEKRQLTSVLKEPPWMTLALPEKADRNSGLIVMQIWGR